MNHYIIRKVLTDEYLIRIKNIISSLKWEDGLRTTVNMTKDIKNNLESYCPEIDRLVSSAIDKDQIFLNFTIPERSSSCLVSKMTKKCYYNAHHDSPFVGDFSTTLFLNDPNEYEGGELLLLINNEEFSIKLKAGEAITYSTGIPHKVNEVIDGERLVGVFWTKSYIKDERSRQIYNNIGKIKNILKKDYDKYVYENLKEYCNNPYFLCCKVMDDILRIKSI